VCTNEQCKCLIERLRSENANLKAKAQQLADGYKALLTRMAEDH